MVKHIVMLKLKDEALGASKEENALKLKESILVLKDVIEELKAVEVGFNFNPSPAAFDVVLYSKYDSKEGLEAFQKHPEHVKVAEFVDEIRTDRVVVDYEV